MPLYEFECSQCGAEFETLVMKSSDKEAVKCPNCGSRKLEELLSTFASGSSDCAPGSGGG
jgi:putative FmdB family regulatory protein